MREISELTPCKKAIEVTEKILKLFEEEKMTFAEVADVPAELTRKINKNISCLKSETTFRCHQ